MATKKRISDLPNVPTLDESGAPGFEAVTPSGLLAPAGTPAPAIEIARRAKLIALESVYVGIGLSTIGMLAAAFGYLTPIQGALLQEVVDVAVILNALRVLRLRL